MLYPNIIDYALLIASVCSASVNVYLYHKLVKKIGNDSAINSDLYKRMAEKIVDTSSVSAAVQSGYPRCQKCGLLVARYKTQDNGSVECLNCVNGNF
jgi:hypothetical protein